MAKLMLCDTCGEMFAAKDIENGRCPAHRIQPKPKAKAKLKPRAVKVGATEEAAPRAVKVEKTERALDMSGEQLCGVPVSMLEEWEIAALDDAMKRYEMYVTTEASMDLVNDACLFVLDLRRLRVRMRQAEQKIGGEALPLEMQARFDKEHSGLIDRRRKVLESLRALPSQQGAVAEHEQAMTAMLQRYVEMLPKHVAEVGGVGRVSPECRKLMEARGLDADKYEAEVAAYKRTAIEMEESDVELRDPNEELT